MACRGAEKTRALPTNGTSDEVDLPSAKAAAIPAHVTAPSQLKEGRKAEVFRPLPSNGNSGEVARYTAKADIKHFGRMRVQLPHQLKSYNGDVRLGAYRKPRLAYDGKQRKGARDDFGTCSSREEHVLRALKEPFPLSVGTPTCPRTRRRRRISAETAPQNSYVLSGTASSGKSRS